MSEAEIQKALSGQAGGGGAEQAAKQAQQMEQRSLMLASVLTGDARERLAKVKIVKPEKGFQVENMICNIHARAPTTHAFIRQHSIHTRTSKTCPLLTYVRMLLVGMAQQGKLRSKLGTSSATSRFPSIVY
jgi:DNA-binding TFAR19-related protein (PDSD5 family)